MIRKLLDTDLPFAAYRLPFADEYRIVAHHSTADDDAVRVDISHLDGVKGFVMLPFSPYSNHDAILIRADEDYMVKVPKLANDMTCDIDVHDAVSHENPTQEYKTAFARFHSAISSGMFGKLVLSRSSEMTLGDIDMADMFVRACNLYPRMMVYMCRHADGQIWIGCTPEILLSGSKSHYRTVALAGTMKDTGNEVPWSEKNRDEQRIVAEYVKSRISPYSSVVEEEGPYTSRAGQLLHLKTEFHFTPRPDVSVAQLVADIHPTPAVCGIPQHEALRFILDNEGIDRSYYAGVVGMLDPASQTDLYVNLRCARIVSGKATLYAGGGILLKSDLDMEWYETEEKMKTIKRTFSSAKPIKNSDNV